MNANKDDNFIPAITGILNTDGLTIERICADPTTHGVCVSDGSTGSDLGPSVALHDGNGIPTIMAVSSVDGKTPVPLYTDSNGNLLIQST